MAQIPVSIAVSPSGTTLLAAQQVTNTAGTMVFNEVVTLGDAGSGNVGSVLASGAQLIEPGGANTQPVTGTVVANGPTGSGSAVVQNPLIIGAITAGAQVRYLQVDASNYLQVNVTKFSDTNPVPVAGTVSANILGPLGQAVMASSVPVVIASNQTAVSVTAGGPAASGAAVSGNPLLQGAVFTTAQPTVTTGQIIDLQATARGGLIVATGADAFTAAITSSSAQTITAAQATAANLNATVVGTVTANVGTGTNADNITQIAGTNVNTAAAGTILVGVADGSNNKITSNSATQSRSLDENVVSVLGATMSKTNPLFVALTDGTNVITAAVSAWGVAPTGTEVQGVNSNLFINGTLASQAAAGVQKVGITGGTGVGLDGTVAAGGAPTRGLGVVAVYNTTAPAPTNGQCASIQSDYDGSLFVKPYRRSQTVGQATTIASSSAATTVLAAQAAGIFADISNLVITVTPAATTDLAFTATLSDGTISYIYDMDTGALATATADPTVININFNPPVPATTAATAWTIQLNVATVTVHISVVAVLQKAS